MSTTVNHSWYMTVRALRNLARQPWYIAVSLSQPVIWLLLFGALFKRTVQIPGFHDTSYIAFLTPGVVVMTALFASGWSGMGFIDDIDRGILDRFLVSPVRRGALTAGSLAYQAISTVIQSAIMVGLAVAVGARFPGGAAGAGVTIAGSVLLAVACASLSNALGLLVRQRETLIAAVQFVVLPASFLSSAFMQQDLAPAWIQHVARYNPVNWATEAGRVALGANADWGLVSSRMGLLAAFALVCAWLGTRAFRTYQRSV
jgi:ABC-2 type transport system permease protein